MGRRGEWDLSRTRSPPSCGPGGNTCAACAPRSSPGTARTRPSTPASAITHLAEAPHPPGGSSDAADRLTALPVANARAGVTDVLGQPGRVATGVGRTTVTIGVSGSARVGKSSLLQSTSGLADAQLPTGSGIPVTAVRSRIHHVVGRRRAVLEPHTCTGFRAAHPRPRHAALGLPDAPTGVAEFRAWRYPAPGERAHAAAAHPTLLNDLREIQATLPSYVDFLDRGGGPFELDGDEFDRLREYVTYPVVAAKRAGDPPCKHLAVRDNRIECAFPHPDLAAIGGCDLPGIGEITLDADRHHVTGLRHEVDVVLLVKRAVEGMAYRGDADARAVTLLNTGDGTPTLVANPRDDVTRKLNEGSADLHLQVLEADAANRQADGEDPAYAGAVDAVHEDVLAWVRNGLGVGREQWCRDALRSAIRDDGGAAFTGRELNRVRVELSTRFAALDRFFHDRVELVWQQAVTGLATEGELRDLLDDRTGAAALRHLADLAGDAAEPCAVTRAALDDLLGPRLDYRTQLHPRVRPELDGLHLQVADDRGGATVQIAVPSTPDGVAELFRIVSELAEQATFRIRGALLREAALPGQVLFAAVEQFDDTLIRSGDAHREIRQLARSYRDRLWPAEFDELDGANARVAGAAAAADLRGYDR
ncbi:hypothetical protein V5P93_006327 [Actinokineospora auranticolor]|uniref:hypothetical protein n=1 Tax=Actinokineospora auranticolor TaxID=155976 RepID=UPI000CECDDE2|nr:hypothetical protein [Actinokineospora auranticolor]